MSCPTPEALARFADAQATPAEAAAVQEHVDGCAACRELLVALATASRGGPGSPATGPAPIDQTGKVLLNRYEVLGTLGAGGMGLVLSARDLKLDRKVALKLVRPDLMLLEQAEQARARLLREAQLMAQVRHPNVVAVYDVGTLGDRIFVSMEHIDGQSVRDWMRPPRPWRQVVGVFGRAGAGLAAAHSAGVVHRDFKPENVLVSARGDVFVTDFGLAWSVHLLRRPPAPDPAAPTGGHEAPTAPSGVLGTPAYMAPEQLRGDRVDAQADQFSFCVALYEALQGQRPFLGSDSAGLLEAIESGQVRMGRSKVPRWLNELIRRGLAARPENRFPSMDALLRKLEKGQRRAGRAVAAALALALVGLALGYAFGLAGPANRCPNPADRLAGIWDAPRRAAVRQAFRATGAPFSNQAWQTVEQAFDGFARRWTDGYRAACEAARVRHEISEETFARRAVCFESRLRELQAFAELFARGDRAVVESAGIAGERLPDLGACESGQGLALAALPDDPDSRAAVADAWLAVARTEALSHAGKFHDAQRQGQAAIEKARATRYRPVEAEALLATAVADRLAGEDREAEGLLDLAMQAAEAGRHFEALPLIAAELVLVSDADSKQVDKADSWARRAESALDPTPRPDLRAEVDMALTVLRLNQQKFEEAKAQSSRAAGLFEKLGQPRRALDARFLLAQAESSLGHPEEALAGFTAVADGRAKLLGPAHPATLRAANREAEQRLELGHIVEAETRLRETLALMQADSNISPAMIALALCYQSAAMSALGRHREAIADARQAVALMEADRGPEHGYAAKAHDALAVALREAHRLPDALEEHERARKVFEASVRADHLDALFAATTYAETELRSSRQEQALARLSPALSDLESKLGPTHPRLVPALVTQAEALADSGKPADGLRRAEAAVRLARSALGPAHPTTARAAYALARVQLVANGPGVASVAPLEEAAAIFEQTRTWPEAHAETLTLLSDLRGPPQAVEACQEARAALAIFNAAEGSKTTWALERLRMETRLSHCPAK